MRRSYKEISPKEKEDLLELYYFKQIQLKELAEIFNISYAGVLSLISEDISRRQKEKENKTRVKQTRSGKPLVYS